MTEKIKLVSKAIKDNYSYLELSENEINDLARNYLENNKIDDNEIIKYMDKIVKQIFCNDIINYDYDFIKNIDRDNIFENYINLNLKYSCDVYSNLYELKKLDKLYKIIENSEDIIQINTNALIKNKKFANIVKSVIKSNCEIEKDIYIRLIKDSYLSIYYEEFIEEESFNSSSNFSIYMKDIKNLPVLSESEKEELLKRGKNGDLNARNKFLSYNLKLVLSIANNYKSKYRDYMDLIQSGNEGLILAFEKFDETKGNKFSTFATWWIRKKIIECIQEKYLIHVPNVTQVSLNKILKWKKYFEENGISQTVENYSKYSGLPENQIKKLFDIPFCTVSLDSSMYDDDCSDRYEYLKADYCIEEKIEKKFDEELIKKLINDYLKEKKISDRDIKIFMSRLNMDGSGPMTYKTIAEKYGLKKQRIHQIYKKIFDEISECFINNRDLFNSYRIK